MSLPIQDNVCCPGHRDRLSGNAWYRTEARHRRLADWGPRDVPSFTKPLINESPRGRVLETDIWRRPRSVGHGSNLAQTALSQLAAADHQRAKTARRILADFSATVEAFDTSGAPDLHLAEADDGALLVEWVFADRRLGFSFEKQPEESGWYFVLSNGSSERYEAGTLDQVEMRRLVQMMLTG